MPLPFPLEGVDSNSARRIRSVSSLTLTIERMSFFVPTRHVDRYRARRNPWMRAAKRSAAATIPSGRRPRTIQSRCIRLVMRSAVRQTAESWSPNSIWEAKRLMYSEGSIGFILRLSIKAKNRSITLTCCSFSYRRNRDST